MFIYAMIKAALPEEKGRASDEMIKGWVHVAHAWLDEAAASPDEVEQAFEQLIAEKEIVLDRGSDETL